MGEQDVKKETEEKIDRGRGNALNRKVGLVLCLLLAAVIGGLWMWYDGKVRVTTDNAFIEGHVHRISARIAGQVLEVPVEDNQRVRAGDVLAVLDPADYRTRVRNAEARLAMARNETSEDYAEVTEEEGALGQARAALEQAELDLRRGAALFDQEVIPREKLDRLRTSRKVAVARVSQVQGAVQAARARIGVAADGGREARIAQREAELAEARLRLSYTRILAPADGYVTRKSVEVGNNIQPGQALMALVELEAPWIVANYKESQLTHLRPGQPVEFTVDAYPGRSFSGTIDSIMAGTGAAFSLLPPENATGNYVKVVQRVPVKIGIDPESDPGHVLRVGMSVVPVVHTGKSLGEILAHLNPFD